MDKKQDILQAAERLFYNNGFHATSTDRICSEAGVSTRTLYRYFPSREILTQCVMEERKNRFFAALQPPGHPEAIGTLFRVLEQWMLEQGALGCFFIKAWGEYAGEDQQLAAQALDFRYALRAYIAACVRETGRSNSDTLVNALWMLFEGAVTTALITGSAAAVHAGNAALLLMDSSKEP